MKKLILASALLGFLYPTLGAARSASSFHQKVTDQQARSILNLYAGCVVKRNPELAARFVRFEIEPRLDDETIKRIAPSGCLMNATLRMRDIYYRGALAEQLIKRQLKQVPALTASSVVLTYPEVRDFDPSRYNSGKPMTDEMLQAAKLGYAQSVLDNYVLRLGECVTKTSPNKARSVLSTRMDNPAEMLALQSLSTEIAGCVSKGETIKFNRTNLRAAIAVSYYRLIATPTLQPQAHLTSEADANA